MIRVIPSIVFVALALIAAGCGLENEAEHNAYVDRMNEASERWRTDSRRVAG